MAGFVDTHLYDSTLPLSLEPALRQLDVFMRDVERARDGDAAAKERLPGLHDALMEAGLEVGQTDPGVLRDLAEASFVSGALRAVHYEQTVHMDDLPVIDTAGSLTLSAFSSDLGRYTADAVRAALIETFTPSADLLASVDALVAQEAQQLQLRHRLMVAMDALYPMSVSADCRDAVEGMFAAFYPGHPLKPGEVEVIRTATCLYFCIPYSGSSLLTRSVSDAELEAFVDKLTHSHPSLAAHFPSFGSLRARDIPAPLLEGLSDHSGLTPSEIAALLPTMVVILPTGKIDQYIVHDAWGHGWQALLFGFEATYQRAARYNRLPRLDDRFSCVGEDGDISMREAFAALVADSAALPVWERFLRAVTATRLYDTLSSLNAEVLADVVEYKFLALHPQHVKLMPSSSFVKEFPTKLDLTLLDMPLYYERALQSLQRFARSGGEIPRLHAALGGDEAYRRAMAAAAEHTASWLESAHGTWPSFRRDEGELQVNTMSRVALNYLEMHARFNRLYDQLRQEDPSVRFADLLVFSSAAFLEQDWSHRFWLLDEFLVHFPSMYTDFMSALSRSGQRLT